MMAKKPAIQSSVNDKFNFDDIVIKKKVVKQQPSLHQRNYPTSNKHHQAERDSKPFSQNKSSYNHKYDNKGKDNFQRIKADIQKSKIKHDEKTPNSSQVEKKPQNIQNSLQQASQQSLQSQSLLKDQIFSKNLLTSKISQAANDKIQILQSNSQQNQLIQKQQISYAEERNCQNNNGFQNSSEKQNQYDIEKEKKQSQLTNIQKSIPEKPKQNIQKSTAVEEKDKRIFDSIKSDQRKSPQKTSNSLAQELEKKLINDVNIEKKPNKPITTTEESYNPSIIDLEINLPSTILIDDKLQNEKKSIISLDDSDIENDINVVDRFQKLSSKKLDFQEIDKVQFEQKENIVEQIEQAQMKNIQYQTKFGNIIPGLTDIAFRKIFCSSISNQISGYTNLIKQKQSLQEKRKQQQDDDSMSEEIESEETKIDETSESQDQSGENNNTLKIQNKQNQMVQEVEATYSENLITYKHNPKVNIKIIGLLNVFHNNELDPRIKGLDITKIIQKQKK